MVTSIQAQDGFLQSLLEESEPRVMLIFGVGMGGGGGVGVSGCAGGTWGGAGGAGGGVVREGGRVVLPRAPVGGGVPVPRRCRDRGGCARRGRGHGRGRRCRGLRRRRGRR